MPNWCENTLIVTGDPEEVDKFVSENKDDKADTEYLLFSKAVPEPTYEGYGDASKDKTPSGLPTWYKWRIENWGTKWEPDGSGIEETTTFVNGRPVKTKKYYFGTAWGPANIWFEKMIDRYQPLRFSYVYGESGNDFGGAFIALDGKVISHLEGQYRDFMSSDFPWL
jgi:hypothetical protein